MPQRRVKPRRIPRQLPRLRQQRTNHKNRITHLVMQRVLPRHPRRRHHPVPRPRIAGLLKPSRQRQMPRIMARRRLGQRINPPIQKRLQHRPHTLNLPRPNPPPHAETQRINHLLQLLPILPRQLPHPLFRRPCQPATLLLMPRREPRRRNQSMVLPARRHNRPRRFNQHPPPHPVRRGILPIRLARRRKRIRPPAPQIHCHRLLRAPRRRHRGRHPNRSPRNHGVCDCVIFRLNVLNVSFTGKLQ